MDEAIEAGAEDIEEYENDEEMENKEEELVEITCDFTELNNISKFLTSNHKYEIRQLEATYVPQSSMEISDPELIESVTKCLDDMENLDDVVKVYTNATIAE